MRSIALSIPNRILIAYYIRDVFPSYFGSLGPFELNWITFEIDKRIKLNPVKSVCVYELDQIRQKNTQPYEYLDFNVAYDRIIVSNKPT